jgi:hypothetical protein
MVRKLSVLVQDYDTWLTQTFQADEDGILMCEELFSIDLTRARR